jgi:hypothetical protein
LRQKRFWKVILLTDSPHENVPVGEWIDVKPNQVMAEGTYVDDAGVMRDSRDHSVVCWHWKPRQCKKRGITPEELVYDPFTNAPWCPECWPDRVAYYKEKQVEELFKGRN